MDRTRLSKSKIWSIMANYYNELGPKAWAEEIVPSDISSNKYLANIYAEFILATLKDWQEKNKSDSPIYIIEVGAGHGRFGFYILKLIEEFSKNDGIPYFKNIKFIMSDISQKNIALWQNHPALQKFIKLGVLDFAIFDAHNDDKIALLLSEDTIHKHSIDTPLIAICNYLFDTLPQDSFKVKNGKLYENLIEISDNKKAKYFENLKYKFYDVETTTSYYDCKYLNNVLESYRDYFSEGSFLIPVGGINFLKNLEQFTKEHFILFLADKANSDLEELEGLDNPEISQHGSVSLMVNFDAIKKFIINKDGIALMMPNKYSDFQIGCFINKKAEISNLKTYFYSRLADFSPQDLFNLCYTEDDEINPAINSLNTVIAILQLAKWDPGIFSVLSSTIISFIEDKEELFLQQEKILIEGISKVWDYFYNIENSVDICFEIGNIFYALEHYEKAIEYYKLSSILFGENAEVLYNIALSFQMLEDYEKSIQYLNNALEIDSNYIDAKNLLKEITK